MARTAGAKASTFVQGANQAGGSELPEPSTTKQYAVVQHYPYQHIDGVIVYRRSALPWRAPVGSSSVGHSTATYATCWVSIPLAHAASTLKHLLLAAYSAAHAVCASTLPSYWQVITMLSDAAMSAAPSHCSMHLALTLAQQQSSKGTSPPRMLMLTCGAACGGGAANGAWGFARVLRLEHVALATQSADVSPDATTTASCGALLEASPTEAEVACTGDTRLVARLRTCTCALTRRRATAVVNGTHAIMGGLGGLGIRAAALLIESSTSQLHLLSRSGGMVRGGRGLEACTRSISHVRSIVCNSADPCAVTNALLLGNSLAGLVHTAGVADKGLLSELVVHRVQWMYASKAVGAWHLQCVASILPLEARMLFSSVGSGLGNVGQANYAAANASLDAQALSRRAHGIAACSLQWPLVGGAGMGAAAFDALRERQVVIAGLAGISLEEYAAYLRAQLSAGAGHVLSVQMVHHSKVHGLLQDLADVSQPRFGDLVKLIAHASSSEIDCSELLVVDRAQTLTADQIRSQLVLEIEKHYLGSQHLDVDIAFNDLSMDSMAIGAFAGSIRRHTGVGIHLQTVMDGNITVRELADSIHDRIHANASAVVDCPSHAHPQPLVYVQGIWQSSVGLETAPAWPRRLDHSMVFIWSSARSGSTLLQLILNVHPQLHAPQELHLLAMADMGEWRQWYDRTVFAEALVSAVAQGLADEAVRSGSEAPHFSSAKRMVASWTDSMPIADVYEWLQRHCDPRLLVDKTPSNADHPAFLRRAFKGWTNPLFIHIFRHPVAVIASLVELEKGMTLVQGLLGGKRRTDAMQFADAEVSWQRTNRNILDVFGESADLLRISYENLVTEPEATTRALCAHLDLPWEANMVDPYRQAKSVAHKTASSVPLGDPKLFKRSTIDAAQAEKWRRITVPFALSASTLQLAASLSYTEFPLQLPEELVWIKPPEVHSSVPPELLLCVHPVSRILSSATGTSYDKVQLWKGDTRKANVLGASFGCRIAFSFASRFDERGYEDVRAVLLDGKVAEQPLWSPTTGDMAAVELGDSIMILHGQEAVHNMEALGQLPIEGGLHMARPRRVMSEHVCVFYTESDVQMGLKRVRELTVHVEVAHIEGQHLEALQRLQTAAKQQAAHGTSSPVTKQIAAFLRR